ncbi:sce7726 family protein [Reichenbachiella sp. MALMAid0571]|uniref:sce7726 family protein n=1 Tax=Reichenbachiella sp. MALMAid0571 TaxID=3143939 RepID=UPI0032E02DFD
MNSLTKIYSSNQLRDYSSLFSRSTVLEWLRGDLSSIDFKVNRYDQIWLSKGRKRYLDYLKYVYNILENNYQNEYILKNSFLNDWLIKELGESQSQVFSEFKVGNAIADLVMFNGVSKVFEIKTEMDSDKRLNTQLEQYRKAFNQIYLIIPTSKLRLYLKYDKSIGIITFDNNKSERFDLKRKAINNAVVEPRTLMHVFHSKEYKEVVKKFFGKMPKMTSFNQFSICSGLIEDIPNNKLNELFIAQMKKRGNKNVLSKKNHSEFNQLSLALKMNSQNRKQFFSILKSPLIS